MKAVDLYDEQEEELRHIECRINRARTAMQAASEELGAATNEMAQWLKRERLMARGESEESIRKAAEVAREGMDKKSRSERWGKR